MAQYFRNIWDGLITVLIGMKVTWRHLFVPSVTIQYPSVKVKLPERARNRLYVNMDDCIGCDQCAVACPVDCITIETVKSTPDVDLGLTSVGTKKRLYVPTFDIDIAKCCYCGLCVYPCPTECIKMTDVYEFSEYERENLIYRFATMTPAETEKARNKLAAYEKEQAAKKGAAARPAPASQNRVVPPTASGGGKEPAAPTQQEEPAPPTKPGSPAPDSGKQPPESNT